MVDNNPKRTRPWITSPVSQLVQPQMEVSTGVTPESSILIAFSLINHPFWGTPIYGNPQIWIHQYRYFLHGSAFPPWASPLASFEPPLQPLWSIIFLSKQCGGQAAARVNWTSSVHGHTIVRKCYRELWYITMSIYIYKYIYILLYYGIQSHI